MSGMASYCRGCRWMSIVAHSFPSSHVAAKSREGIGQAVHAVWERSGINRVEAVAVLSLGYYRAEKACLQGNYLVSSLTHVQICTNILKLIVSDNACLKEISS